MAQIIRPKFTFGTKAETLNRLQPLLQSALILKQVFFTVQSWTTDADTILQQIRTDLSHATLLAIRSSACNEDGAEHSMAGAFTSILNVDAGSRQAITQATETVIASYVNNPENQVLVQPMLSEIAVSGVITTQVLNDGAPYYVINYDDESGRTDTVTGGTGVSKTVFIHRNTHVHYVDSPRVRLWLGFTRELERLCDCQSLDIEFAQSHDGTLYLLQVRRLTVENQWNPEVSRRLCLAQVHIETFIHERSLSRPSLVGNRTILGEMPDWNPAEIIGITPRPLAFSLYRHLITDQIWSAARVQMGYRAVQDESLMVNIGGRPFIDVRNSFNSFLPVALDDTIAEKLVNAWLDRLDHHPEFHDKVEFNIAQTALDFNFQAVFDERYAGILSSAEQDTYRQHLTQLTLNALDLSPTGSLSQALQDVAQLRATQNESVEAMLAAYQGRELVFKVKSLLSLCRQYGTFAFSIVARHAFIAESLLRSAVSRGALSIERLEAFKASLSNVTSRMSEELQQVISGQRTRQEFMQHYGHLRPGTYDILSPRYDQREGIFAEVCPSQSTSHVKAKFVLTPEETTQLDRLLCEAGLDARSAQELMDYSEKAIVGREYAKFVFSRNLSDALELIARWGEGIGLNRHELSFIDIHELLDTVVTPILQDDTEFYQKLALKRQAQLDVTRALRLSYLIRNKRDIYVIPLHRSAPNFVTQKILEASTLYIDTRAMGTESMTGKIICIENADPGFDWIFTRGITGLVTKFGGSNSHMAIRCAEFGLPAAIGCGEQTFERLVNSQTIHLNCADKIVRPAYT